MIRSHASDLAPSHVKSGATVGGNRELDKFEHDTTYVHINPVHLWKWIWSCKIYIHQNTLYQYQSIMDIIILTMATTRIMTHLYYGCFYCVYPPVQEKSLVWLKASGSYDASACFWVQSCFELTCFFAFLSHFKLDLFSFASGLATVSTRLRMCPLLKPHSPDIQ